MFTSIAGRAVVVTGGTRGIGKGIASVFARNGAKVLITGRDSDAARAAADELTAKVKDRLANKIDKRVYIKADARAKYGGVVDVVDNVRSAGVDDVGLLTEQIQQGPAGKKPPATGTSTGAGSQ